MIKEPFGAQGIEYHNISVEWGKPTTDDLNKFLDLMDAHKESNVLVHCQANYRASAFVALYHILHLGWDHEKAFTDMNKIWNPEEYPLWEDFIESHLQDE